MTYSKSDAVRKAGHKLADSGWAIPATIAFLGLLYVCARIFIRDIETSMWGYQQFPTNKGGLDISLYVALFFPLMQIACGYLAIALGFDDNKANDKWAKLFAVLTIFGFAFDAGMDIFFRIHEIFTPINFAVAVFETFAIYTLGSEVALSIAIAAVVVLLPYAVRDFIDLLRRLKTGAQTRSPMETHPIITPSLGFGKQPKPKSKPKREKGAKGKVDVGALLRRDPGIAEMRRLEQELFDTDIDR